MPRGHESTTGVKYVIHKDGKYRIQAKIQGQIINRGPFRTIAEAKTRLDYIMQNLDEYLNNAKPYMSDDEIRWRYRNGNRAHIVGILADLNACSRQTILKIVEAKND